MLGSGRSTRGFVALGLVVGLAGCTPSRSPMAPTPNPTRSAASPSASSSPSAVGAAGQVQLAIAAYRGMWDAYLRVLQNPDPDSPELATYATGDAFNTLVNGVREVKNQGLKGEGSFALDPKPTEIGPAADPTKVSVRDCVNTAQSRVVRASPGPAYSDKPGGRRLCLATVERQSDGAWKVTSFGLREVGTCT